MRCGLLGELLLDLVVGARRVGDVEPALLVEVGGDRPIDQRRAGDQLDGEPVRHAQGRSLNLNSPAPTDQKSPTRANVNARDPSDHDCVSSSERSFHVIPLKSRRLQSTPDNRETRLVPEGRASAKLFYSTCGRLSQLLRKSDSSILRAGPALSSPGPARWARAWEAGMCSEVPFSCEGPDNLRWRFPESEYGRTTTA